jgi:hypothetical protein
MPPFLIAPQIVKYQVVVIERSSESVNDCDMSSPTTEPRDAPWVQRTFRASSSLKYELK